MSCIFLKLKENYHYHNFEQVVEARNNSGKTA